MARVSDMHKRWMKDPKYRKAYGALQEEFALAEAVIEARRRVGSYSAPISPKDGHHAAGRCSTGKWQYPSVATHVRTTSRSYRIAPRH